MKWAEVSIKTTHEATELIAEMFHDLGASGVVIEDPELLQTYLTSGTWDYTDEMLHDERGVAVAVGDACPHPGGGFGYWRNEKNSNYIYINII